VAHPLGTEPADMSTAAVSREASELAQPAADHAVAAELGTARTMPDASVYVVSTDPRLREDLVAMLAREGVRAWGFLSGTAFLAALRDLAPGCVLVAAAMDGEDPTSLQRELRVRGCGFPVIAVTPASDVAAAVRAMKAGASDVVTRPLRCDDLREAVVAAIAMLTRSQAAESSIAQMRTRVDSLTRRELQVLDAMVRGAANKAIAHELGISPRTVEVHRAKVMGKLACRSLPELVHIAVRLGIAQS